MIQTSRAAANLFTGVEELSQINTQQMNALLLFESWPEKHEGPGDIGDNEGLGGLMDVVKKDNKDIKPSEDEVESEDTAEERPDGGGVLVCAGGVELHSSRLGRAGSR